MTSTTSQYPPSTGHSTRRYLVVEDHPLFCEAIRATLHQLDAGQEVDAVNSLGEALDCFDQHEHYELTVVDLDLPDSSGVQSLQALREQRPDSRLVVFSAQLDGETILRCLELGASGYIPKTLNTEAVMHALRLVQAGDIYVPKQAMSALDGPRPGGRGTAEGTDPRTLGLTERQIAVLRLILRGLPNKLICRELHLAEGTIKVHVSAILRALGVRNRTQAIISARELGLRLDDASTGTGAGATRPAASRPN